MSIYEWTDKMQKREAQRVRGTTTYHSRFYHTEFEGYAEREYVDEKGRRRIDRFYAAEYYEPKLTKKQFIKYRMMDCCLFAVSAACYFHAGLQDIESNYAVYVVIPVAVSLVFLSLILLALVHSLLFGRLKLPQMNKGPRKLRRFPFYAAASLFATAMATVCFALSNTINREILTAALHYGLAGLTVGILGLLERRIDYSALPNHTDLTGAIMIR